MIQFRREMVHLVLSVESSKLRSILPWTLGSRVQTHCDRVEYQTGSFPFPAEVTDTAWLLWFFDKNPWWCHRRVSWLEHCFLEQFGYIVYCIYSQAQSTWYVCVLFFYIVFVVDKSITMIIFEAKDLSSKSSKGSFFLRSGFGYKENVGQMI